MRNRGTISTLKPTFGFIQGEDGISRFFLPSGLQVSPGVSFGDLRVGMRVEFLHIDHPRGPRAFEILILDPVASALR